MARNAESRKIVDTYFYCNTEVGKPFTLGFHFQNIRKLLPEPQEASVIKLCRRYLQGKIEDGELQSLGGKKLVWVKKPRPLDPMELVLYGQKGGVEV